MALLAYQSWFDIPVDKRSKSPFIHRVLKSLPTLSAVLDKIVVQISGDHPGPKCINQAELEVMQADLEWIVRP